MHAYSMGIKRKAVPLQAWTGFLGLQDVETPRISKQSAYEVVRLLAQHTGHLYCPEVVPGTHFC